MADSHFNLDAALAKSKGNTDSHFNLDAALSGEDFSAVKGGASSTTTAPPPTPSKGFYDSPLFSFNSAGQGGYAEDAAGKASPVTRVNVSPRDVANQVPTLAAMYATGGMGPTASLGVRAAAAFLGGAGGSALQQTGEAAASLPPAPNAFGSTNPAAKMASAGTEQALYELPAALLGKAAAKFKKSLPGTPEEKVAESLGEKLGLDLKPREIVPALTRQQEIRNALQGEGEQIASVFGVKDTPHEAGTAIYNANQKASDIAHAMSRENYAKLEGLTVDLQPHADTLKSIPRSLLPPELVSKLNSIDELRAAVGAHPSAGGAAMVKKAEGEAFGSVPFQTVQQIRTAVREAANLPPGQALMANQNIGALKKIKGELSSILDSAATSQGKGAEWKAATEFHKGIGDLFERGLGGDINRVGLKDPQKIVDLISPNDINAVRQMKEIFSYAQKAGSPVERIQAQAAQKKFQRAFLDSKILSTPVQNWKKQIDKKVGRDVLAEVLGNAGEAERFYEIANTAAKIAPDSKLTADAISIAAAKSGFFKASFGSIRQMLRDITFYATPSVKNSREYIKGLEDLSSSVEANRLRGGVTLVRLWEAMGKEKSPAAEAPPMPSGTPFPQFPNPYPGPIRP